MFHLPRNHAAGMLNLALFAAGATVAAGQPVFDYRSPQPVTGNTLGALITPLDATDGAGSVHGDEVRSRVVDVDWAVLDSLAPGVRVDVPFFEDVSIEAIVQRVEQHSPTETTWFGQIAGIPLSDFLIVRCDDAVYAQFRDYGHDRYLEIRYSPMGVYVARQIRGDAGDFCDIASQPPADDIPPTRVPASDSQPGGGSGGEHRGSMTIDILCVYTPQARAAEGGTAAMHALIRACVDDTNVRMTNSGVQTRLRIVWRDEMVGYTEAPCLDLERLSNLDGHMDAAITLRNYYNADLVSLFCNEDCPSSSNCGEAWLLGPGSGAGTGFSRVRRTCNITGRTFAHEIGHNLGACHEVGDGGGVCTGSFPHPHGKRWTCDLGACDQVFTDTMAYGAASCYAPVVIPFYSHRDLTYNPGEEDCTFCGPCPERAIGDADTHFAAGTMYFYGRVPVAAFRNEHARKFALAGYGGPQEGTALEPYALASTAIGFVSVGGDVVLQASIFNEGARTYNRPCTVSASGGTAELR